MTSATRPALLRDLAAHLDSGAFEADLARRVARRTESDTGDVPPALEQYLREDIVPSLEPLGFDCRIERNPDARGGPFLVARRIEDASLPTLLTYGHGDVVSGQEGRWKDGLQPWHLTRRGDRWFGRGTADNKGQHTIALAALASTIAARGGKLGYNVTVLLETGEEAGSPGLNAFCEANKDLLRADLLVACDGPRVSAATPTLLLGSRGAVNFSLRLSAREKAYHSGNWGGVLANPATLLAHAWATLVDARGRILVPELRPSPLTPEVRAAVKDVPVGGSPDDPQLEADWGEPGLSPIERLVAWNTIEVLAMESGSPARPINAIPPTAVIHGQLRFIPGTPYRDLEAILRRHLASRGFGQVEVKVGLAMAAACTPVSDPWVAWAAASVEKSAGKRAVVLPSLGGSIPNDVFRNILGMPTLWVPHSYPACSQHAPNEHLLVDVAREGLQLMGGLYWDLGEPGAPWPRRR